MTRPISHSDPENGRAAPPTVGRFKIQDRLGEGSFGTVYQAYDPRLKRDVALKVPRAGTLSSATRVERFLDDARAAARLYHPHIVPVFDAGQEGGCYFIASAFIEGGTLAEALDACPPPARRAAEIVRDLADALAYAHEQGVIHRDVKPANVMLDGRGQPYLIDFGLARCRDVFAPEPAADSDPAAPPDLPPDDARSSQIHVGTVAPREEAKRTRIGAVLGTVEYMAPEQAAGHSGEVRPAVDQYSLGATFYELLTGRTPFTGPTALVLFNVQYTQPLPPRSIRSDVPLDLEVICLKAMAKRPEDRYASCNELAEDLRLWLKGEPIRIRRLGMGERASRWLAREPRLAAALAVAFGCLVLAAVVLAVSARQSSAWAKDEKRLRHRAEDAQGRAEAKEKEVIEVNQVLEVTLGEKDDALKRADANEQTAKEEARKAKEATENERDALRKVEKKQDELNDTLRKSRRDQYFLLIGLAERALRDGQPKRANDLLQLCNTLDIPPGWEWRHLEARVLEPRQHDDHVFGLAFRPNRLWLAWANSAGAVVLRRLDPRAEPIVLHNATEGKEMGRVICVAFSADGNLLGAGCDNGAVCVWQLEGEYDKTRANVVFREKNHDGPVNCVAFSPDDYSFLKVPNSGAKVRFVSAGSDRSIHVSDIPDNPRSGKWDTTVLRGHHAAAIRWVAFDPLGKRVASGGADNQLRLWDLDDKKNALPPLESITAGAFQLKRLPTVGGYQAVAKENGVVVVYDLNTKKACSFGGHSADVLRLSFARAAPVDKDRAASVSEDGVIKVWTVGPGGNTAESYSTRTRGGFAFAPSGQHLAWIGEDGNVWVREEAREKETITRYSFDTGRFIMPRKDEPLLGNYAEWCHAVDWHFTGEDLFLFTAASVYSSDLLGQSLSGELKKWALPSGRLVAESRVMASVRTVACAPNGDVAWAGLGPSVWVATLTDGEPQEYKFPGQGGAGGSPDPKQEVQVEVVAFSPNDRRHLAACAGRQILVWEVESRKVVLKYTDPKADITALAYSFDGEYLAWGNAAGEVFLRRTDDNKAPPVKINKAHDEKARDEVVNALAFSPDGKLLAAGGNEQQIKLWSLDNGNVVGAPRTLEGHAKGVRGLAFHPKEDRLASSGRDRTVRLWETATGREVLSLPAGTALSAGLAFSSDGRRLAAATVNGPRVWDALPR